MTEQIKTKNLKRHYLLTIIWLLIIVFLYFAFQFTLQQINYKKNNKQELDKLSNVKNQIYKTNQGQEINLTNSDEEQKRKTLNLTPSKDQASTTQQNQILQLQNDYNQLKLELERIKTNNKLPRMILSFVKLIDLTNLKQNYQPQLHQLELLFKGDKSLENKLEKLKSALAKSPKNNQELHQEYMQIINSNNSSKTFNQNKPKDFWQRLKLVVGNFITIKKINPAQQELEKIKLTEIEANIVIECYSKALEIIKELSVENQEIFLPLTNDLGNAIDLQNSQNDIYQYLNLLTFYP